MPKRREDRSVDSSVYDVDYYLGECDGYEEFLTSGGQVLPKRLAAPLALACVQPGMRVLDVGCGRGETLIWLSREGVEAWGLDYAREALRLAKEAVRSADLEAGKRCFLLAANACRLPFASESFDIVLMLDIAEHLHTWELKEALREIWRVLKRDGWLIVHTAPNLWYYKFGYPVYRFFERLRGVRLPRDPRERFRYHRYVHINEQSPISLARVLRQAGFQPRVWLVDLQQQWKRRGALICALGWLAVHVYPLRWIFCGDILSKARKRLKECND